MTDLTEIKKFWDQRTEKFHKKAPVRLDKGKIYNWLMTRAHKKQLGKMLALYEPRSVLEIGVGQGRLFSKIEHIPKVGIDISPNMLRECSTKDNGLSNLVQGEASHLPFKDRCFDMVYSCTVLLHIPSDIIAMVVSEMIRIADKYIFIIEPSPYFKHLNKPYSNGGYCFPHDYLGLFQLSIKYRDNLDKFGQEAILFVNRAY